MDVVVRQGDKGVGIKFRDRADFGGMCVFARVH
jgi:hypothetical protein